MHEIIELFIIGIISFAFAFISYSALTIRYYKRKIKKLKNMSPTVTDLILKSLEDVKNEQIRFNERLIEIQDDWNDKFSALDKAVAKISVKIGWKATIVGALSSGLLVGIAILMKGI